MPGTSNGPHFFLRSTPRPLTVYTRTSPSSTAAAMRAGLLSGSTLMVRCEKLVE